MSNKPDPNLKSKLDELARLANEAGAEGVWLIRGAQDAHLIYGLEAQAAAPKFAGVQAQINFSLNLAIADTGVLVIMRFPSDGHESGIESK